VLRSLDPGRKIDNITIRWYNARTFYPIWRRNTMKAGLPMTGAPEYYLNYQVGEGQSCRVMRETNTPSASQAQG
jgi:hypothetical protein